MKPSPHTSKNGPKIAPTSGPERGPLRADPREPAAVFIAIKAVPGASRDQIAGLLGDRIKVRVAAPPEGGKANAAICGLLADALGVPTRQAEVVAGHTRAEKTVRVTGITLAAAKTAMDAASGA